MTRQRITLTGPEIEALLDALSNVSGAQVFAAMGLLPIEAARRHRTFEAGISKLREMRAMRDADRKLKKNRAG